MRMMTEQTKIRNEEIENVYKEKSQAIKSKSFSFTKNNELAEDLMQKTFLKALESHHQKTTDCKMYTWIYSINNNAGLNLTRTRKYWQFDEIDDSVEFLVDNVTPLDNVINSETSSRIIELLNTLPEKQRQAVTEVVLNDMSLIELSKKYNLNYNTTKHNYLIGLKKIKEKYIEMGLQNE